MHPSAEITQILSEIDQGDAEAVNRLMPLVYPDLRRLAASYMRNERAEVTLQPTALVNEAYLRLVDYDRIEWRGRSHFFAISAQAMRRILVDAARTRGAQKRGGGRTLLSLSDELSATGEPSEDVLDLHRALEKLGAADARMARIVELKVFGGLTSEEVADYLGVSRRTVTRDWHGARAWLKRELSA